MTAGAVIFVDDEEHLRISAAQTFDLAGLDCHCLAEGRSALDRIDRNFGGVVVSDIRMPGLDGIELMRRVIEIDPDLPVILVTGHGDVDLAVSCIKEGAYDFIEKPFRPDRLVACVRRALEVRRLTLENRLLHQRIGDKGAARYLLTGRSAAMSALREQVRAVAATDVDVLITGATGTGKEVAARAIHELGERSGGPFVHVNCAALPEALVESELFGHEAGAFAGATRPRYGKFEHARRGVLCLDEIDNLTLPLQAKLLHALQNRVITRLGSNETIDLDIRVIAISKSDLAADIAGGRFRRDLYYLLNVVSLHLPDLSERREDIPLLFAALVAGAAERYGRAAPQVPGALLSLLLARDWPGNVRELRNLADRLVLGLDLGLAGEGDPTASTSLADMMAAHEKAIIASAIAGNGGRLKPTYEALGLSRKSLYEKMQKHGLSRKDFSDPG